MKPISVRFRCFGPYMAEQFIDFEPLEEQGLFLICGETGAGKTTILDAICYALYGRSSGGQRGELAVMRCKLAGKEDETLVEFIFDAGGKRYRFIRSLKYGRKNLNDSHNCMVQQDGVYVPIFENPKQTNVNEKAQQLIGLTYDQFRQVIILPQGQFERLLVSDSVEKEKILVSLFHADRWQRIADELHRRVMEQDSILNREKAAIASRLENYGCSGCRELAVLLEQEQKALASLEEAVKEAAAQLASSQAIRERALLESRDFEELGRRRLRLDELRKKAADAHREETVLALAEKAETIAPVYAALEEAQGLLKAEKTDVTRYQTALEIANTDHLVALTGKKTYDDGLPEQEQRKSRITLLESSRELYRSLGEKKQLAEKWEKALKKATSRRKTAEDEFIRLDKAWREALAAQANINAQYTKAQEEYLRGIGGVLAEKLSEGEPCPVCGSREHPAPAQPGSSHVTEAQLDALNSSLLLAGKAVSLAFEERSQAEGGKNTALSQEAEAEKEAALTKQDYDTALSRRLSGTDTLGQLEKQLATLKDKCLAYDQLGATVTADLTEAAAKMEAAKRELDKARLRLTATQSAFDARRNAWKQALNASGLESHSQYLACVMEPEERRKRSNELMGFYSELRAVENAFAEQEALLYDRTQPNMSQINAALENAMAVYNDLSRRLALLTQRLETMEADLTSLLKRQESHDQRRQSVNEDLAFANRLCGRSGISLQRYVLGVMLTSITAQANRMLKNVYGGRYQLHRTDEIAGPGRKSGLELEVYDNSNSQRRSVTTLSGGEKFLVSLSLAIGLSTVVQAQGSGIRLEAMFIDEGFGSLDGESITDALEVLRNLGKTNGIVGIISHVEQLAESIPARIEIRKGHKGSQCHVRI